MTPKNPNANCAIPGKTIDTSAPCHGDGFLRANALAGTASDAGQAHPCAFFGLCHKNHLELIKILLIYCKFGRLSSGNTNFLFPEICGNLPIATRKRLKVIFSPPPLTTLGGG
jgi:hypothetical protein